MGSANPTILGHDELSTLRRAAAMAHTVGAIGLRLSAGGVTIADVVPHAHGRGVPVDRWRAERAPGPRIDPCGFRVAVAKAWDDHTAGRKVGLVGFDGDARLTITWTVSPPGKVIGFGAVRAFCATRTVWAFASLLEPDPLSTVLADAVGGANGSPADAGDELTANLIHDELLDATVIHIEADPTEWSTTRILDEALRRMVAAVGAAEVVAELARG